jgi:hypothetical protein
MSADDESIALEMEHAALAALCQRANDDPLRSELLRLLPHYSWISGDHRAVFDAIAQWKGEPAALRSDLPGRLTRLGFPDIDIELYFEPGVELRSGAIGWFREHVPHNSSGSDSRGHGIHGSR